MHKKRNIKAIIWDLDGTLIDFRIDSMKARRICTDILISHGIDKDCLSVEKGILANIILSKKVFKSMGYNSGKIKEIYKEIDLGISKIEYNAALNATVIEGIEDVLIFARKNNLKQAIYTLNKYKHAQISLENVHLLDYFNIIIGRDNVLNPKPHPDHLLEICKILKVKPTEIIVIGDTFSDIKGAINVGAISIGLKTKLAKLEKLQKADAIVEERELPSKLIKEIEKFL